eukprot:1304680-Prorocentrum_lima.AAC.1
MNAITLAQPWLSVAICLCLSRRPLSPLHLSCTASAMLQPTSGIVNNGCPTVMRPGPVMWIERSMWPAHRLVGGGSERS